MQLAYIHIEKRVNLALQWPAKMLYLRTDSLSQHHWIFATLIGKGKLETKVTNKKMSLFTNKRVLSFC